MICKKTGCIKIVVSKQAGWCSTHYDQEVFRLKKPLYRTWQSMKNRCKNPNERFYYLYGGRGIKVCDRWLNSYDNFVADMGPKPSPNHSLDRIDNDGDYEPSNCRWATKKEQIDNRRPEKKARITNKSGHVGVRFHCNRWQARGRYGLHIGSYATKREAIKARQLWEKSVDKK